MRETCYSSRLIRLMVYQKRENEGNGQPQTTQHPEDITEH